MPADDELRKSPESVLPSTGVFRASLMATLFGLLVFVVIFSLVPDKSRMYRALSQTRWPVMALAVVVLALSLLADAGRLWFLCKGIGATVPFGRIVQGIMASNFVSLITPFVSGGAPCIVWVLQQCGVDMSHASAAVVAGGVISQSMLVMLSVVIPLLSGIFRATDAFAHLLWTATVAVVPVYLIGVILVAIGSYRIDFIQRLASSWEARLAGVAHGKGFAGKLRSVLKTVAEGLHGYRSSFSVLATERPSILARAYLCSFLYFTGVFTVGYLTLVALGVQVDYLRAVAAQVVILLVASATPTPGGSGASEFGAYSLFTLIIPREVVALFIVIWRILTYWLLLFTGAIALALAVQTSTESISRRKLRPATSRER